MTKKITEYSYILYLGTAPIYWIPNIDNSVWLFVKYTLFFSLLASTTLLSYKERKLFLPLGIFGIGGFILLLVFYLPGFVQSDWNSVKVRIFDIILSLVFFLAVFNTNKLGVKLDNIIVKASYVIGLFCIIVVLAHMGIIYNYVSEIRSDQSLNTAGFGGVRTGWSAGISLYLPFLLYGLSRAKNNISQFICIVFIISIILNQLIVGGRSGLVVSIFLLLLYAYINMKKFKTYVIALFVLMLSMSFLNYYDYDIVNTLKLDRIIGDDNLGIENVDHFSAGRIYQYQVAIDGIQKNFFTGQGLNEFGAIVNISLHNVWLRLWYESGILLILTFIVMVCKSLILKNNYMNKVNIYLSICIISGCLLALFEPNVLIGTFQNSAMWWVAFSMYYKD